MKRLILGSVLALGACDAAGVMPTGAPDGGMREFLVIGGGMSFEQCRARGGLIIRDGNTNMVACDPSVRGEPAPADEFDNPSNTAGA